jgi:hypothetical protein
MRTPIPNTRPMVCGFIPDYDGISGDARRHFLASICFTAVAGTPLWT